MAAAVLYYLYVYTDLHIHSVYEIYEITTKFVN